MCQSDSLVFKNINGFQYIGLHVISISFGSECVSCPSSSCVPLSHHSSQLIFSQSEPRSSNCHSFIIQRESKRENKDKKRFVKNYSKNYMLNPTLTVSDSQLVVPTWNPINTSVQHHIFTLKICSFSIFLVPQNYSIITSLISTGMTLYVTQL